MRLIGRDRELAALRLLLDRAAAGAGGVLVVYGPPGAVAGHRRAARAGPVPGGAAGRSGRGDRSGGAAGPARPAPGHVPRGRPAATFAGQPLPYAHIGAAAKAAPAPSAGPVALRAAFEPVLADPRVFEHAVIPVEDIRGPVLFVSGEADTMWPATVMTRVAEQRARDRGFPHPVVHLCYRDGGHKCAGVPGTPVVTEVRNHPLTGGRYSFGGTRTGNARALADSWPRVVAFLRDAIAA